MVGGRNPHILIWGVVGFQRVLGGREWVSENSTGYFAQKVRSKGFFSCIFFYKNRGGKTIFLVDD